MEWPSATRTPARVSLAIKSSGTCSGAKVTRVTPGRCFVIKSRSLAVGCLMWRGAVCSGEGKGPLGVNPDTAGLWAAEPPTRRHRRFHFCRGVADQRRKQGGGANPTMRRYDPPYRFRCWCVIEQNVATAVDLQ